MRNFGTWLKTILIDLFLPDFTSATKLFADFTTNNHGLASVITAPIVVLNNITSGQYTCSPISIPLPYMQKNLNLPCFTPIYEQHMGALFNVWQMVINGIVGYYLVLQLFAMVKGFKDPKKDQIEAHAL